MDALAALAAAPGAQLRNRAVTATVALAACAAAPRAQPAYPAAAATDVRAACAAAPGRGAAAFLFSQKAGRRQAQAAGSGSLRLKWHKAALSLWLCSLLVLSACRREREQVAAYTAAPGQTAGWSVHNTAARDILFSLRVNDRFWSDRRQMVAEIAGHSRDTQTFVVRAAEWVHRYSRHTRPLSADNWPHSPEVFINSLGLDYCDDRASVLVSLWRAYGLRARIWNLQGHVVPEVMVAGKWQLYDPDIGVFMLDDELQVCSVADVAAGRARYYQLEQERHPIRAAERTLLLIDTYTSVADNQLSDWYHASNLLPDGLFRLPPTASIHCCAPDPQPPHSYRLELRLPPGSHGQLSVPLVLAAFPPSLSPRIVKVDSLYPALQVANRQADTLSLFYHINPYLLAGQRHTRLIMKGKDVDQLTVNWHPSSQPYHPPRYLDDFRNRFLRDGQLNALIPKLPVPQSFEQLPEVFTHYYLLQGINAQELQQRQEAFRLRFRQLLTVMQQRPALARLFLQNPVYQILLFELCQTLDPQEVLPYLENLSL